jgi:hypothetical protein
MMLQRMVEHDLLMKLVEFRCDCDTSIQLLDNCSAEDTCPKHFNVLSLVTAHPLCAPTLKSLNEGLT